MAGTPPAQLDHVVILLPYDNIINPPGWLTDHFTISPGGKHADGKTENRLILFKDGTYVELIAFINDDPDKRRGHWWDKPYGIIDFALTSESQLDHAALNARLRDATGGVVSYAAPREGGRTTPDGQEMKWRVTFPQGLERGEVPFWCHDVTPRQRRVSVTEASTTHPCGAVGMASIHVEVNASKRQHVRDAMGAITQWPLTNEKAGIYRVGVPTGTGEYEQAVLVGSWERPVSTMGLILLAPGGRHLAPISKDIGDVRVLIAFDGSG